MPEPHLTRRPDPHRSNSWLIYFGDIHCGSVSQAVGLPGADYQAWRDQRDWTARKYVLRDRGEPVPLR